MRPTSRGAEQIARAFFELAEREEHVRINMGCTVVRRVPSPLGGVRSRRPPHCETTACHAGAFALWEFERGLQSGWGWKEAPDWVEEEVGEIATLRDFEMEESISYIRGVISMTRMLFALPPGTPLRTVDTMARWFARHKDVWGNEHGGDMFMAPEQGGNAAFGVSANMDEWGNYQEVPIREIAQHWLGVAQRLEAREESARGWLGLPRRLWHAIDDAIWAASLRLEELKKETYFRWRATCFRISLRLRMAP